MALDPFAGTFSADQLRDVLASGTYDVGGLVLRSLQGFKYEEEQEGDAMYANGSLPIGDTPGTYKGSGSFTIIPTEATGLQQYLGDQYTQVPTTIGITLNQQFGASITPINMFTVRLKKFAWDFGEAGANKPALVEVNFRILKPAEINGMAAVRDGGGAFFFAPILGL